LSHRFATPTLRNKENDNARHGEWSSDSQKPMSPRGGLFDRLTPETVRELLATSHTRTFEPGEVLFSEGDQPEHAYLILDGTVKLSINSTGGQRLILGMAMNGDFAGPASVLCNKPQVTTVETVYTPKIAVLAANHLRNFLLRHPDAYAVVSEELGRELTKACEQLRTVVLSSSAPQKLARLFLDWSKSGRVTETGARFRFVLTHEELGECIGASRETVTRVMTTFKSKNLVMLSWPVLTIPNMRALEHYASASKKVMSRRL
jgi:CRP/FNR family cyclic AMP-dependent transcriptional regulator